MAAQGRGRPVQLVATEPLEVWKDYLAFHALDRAAAYLPKKFADARFAFHGTALSGTPQQSDRWKRAVDDANHAVGEAIGKRYVEKHFDAKTKERADEMAKNIIAAFAKRIDALAWMSPQTKASAKAKVAGLTVGMGYPEKWRDYTGLEIRRDDPLGNAQRAELFEYQRNIAKLGKPVDHGEWAMLPQTINAMNVPLENRPVFPAAILQPPFFDGAADDAVNYGAIGAVIGHEISHGFDNAGALFDETGKLHNWWTAEDLKQFNAAGDALAAQFSSYEPFPGVHVNGKLTLARTSPTWPAWVPPTTPTSCRCRASRARPGRLHPGPALLPRLCPGLAQQEPRAGAAQLAADRCACTGPVPRTHRAQHRRVVPGVRREGRPEAVPGPGQAGQGVVM